MANFSWLDYTIFGAYLLTSVAIGLFSARGQSTMKDYFLAGQKVNRFVVAMTILAALFSGVSYIAGPAEVYKNGIAFSLVMLSFFIATPFTAIFLLPYFYNSRYFTAYHFFQDRFSLPVRLLASGLFILRVSLWLAAATYAPALALEKVTGLPLWFTILCTGMLTTVYTVFGGMKAVIWTDVMQLAVLFGGQLLIVLLATSKIPGGFAGVWETAGADGKLNISFSFDPSVHATFWATIIGGAFLSLVQMATDQVSVQRYLTAGSLRDAQRSLWIKLWMMLPVLVLFYGTGLVLYAFYKVQGDPLTNGLIQKEDQILPFFVVTQLPAGLAGVLIAAIFAASMSTVSAGINSLTSATLCDFYQTLSKPDFLTEKSLLAKSRWYTLFFGVLVTALAFFISTMKSNLVQSVNTIIALVGGPMVGLFLLGIFTKKADTRGAIIGCVVGFVALLGINLFAAQHVNFLWHTMIGTIITMVFGLLTSGRSELPSVHHRSP
ncbi:sodium/solute symporter [Roseimicrobium sp. ORNL1]|uniref:sodium:solute symporter family transporter n=1 Tax=Roseimicrobium sp. ORNL1 TaxID=2711231 RepID=UPI0013E12BA7|nr:sodium/solute symporter [Roseimicrobium sp. ORNL1]QIF05236.1 sodium/solute symporter [Roseimicrobium sp. ORNL1]